MVESNDNELLAQFTQTGSESAFATLVSRHLNLVYSAALRFTRNPHDAEEIAQAVFIILARKAPTLGRNVVLPGWLYQTARLTSANLLKSENRRRRREHAAYMESVWNESGSRNWEQIAPLLDDAMGKLGETDRNAILLRFFEKKSGLEVAAALKMNESAVNKRVSRALEKLRKIFAKRGVASTTAIIAGVVSANSVQAAPATLATSVSAAAITKGAGAAGSTLILIKEALKTMAWTKAKTAIVVSAGVLIAVATTTVTVKEISAHRNEPWQEKYDLSLLQTLPPQVKIRPSLSSTLQSNLHLWGGANGKALGLGQTVPDLFALAYGVQTSQLIWNAPVPPGRFDFIANLPGNNIKPAQDGLKETFGLTGRRVTMETNVLVLTVESRNATGLKLTAGKLSGSQTPDSFSAHDQSFKSLVDYVQNNLGTVVVDQTKLDGAYDIDFKWDSTLEGLQRVFREELGLKLMPGRQPVEFVVIEKAK